MPIKTIEIGTVFGKLTVIEQLKPVDKASRCRCLCVCGNEITVKNANLKSGNTTGCRPCASRKVATKHGMSSIKEYRIWKHMKHRCLCKNADRFKYYGLIGVKIYQPWIESFQAFYEYVGKMPTAKHTLDRINPFGNYEPGNVRWATWKEQANNKRNNSKCAPKKVEQ